VRGGGIEASARVGSPDCGSLGRGPFGAASRAPPDNRGNLHWQAFGPCVPPAVCFGLACLHAQTRCDAIAQREVAGAQLSSCWLRITTVFPCLNWTALYHETCALPV